MPFAVVTTNVASASVDKSSVLHAISKAISVALGKAEIYVMVQLQLDTPMMFQGTEQPCAMVMVRSVEVDPATNNKSAKIVTDAVSQALGVDPARVFMNFHDIVRSNWAMDGHTF